MIKEKSDDRMFGKVVQFLQTTPLPGSIVSKTGEIIFLNERMMALVNLGQGNHVYKCSWLVGEDSGSCPDCAEAPVLEGRCLVSRENSAITLLTAIRVLEANNALVRLYSNGTSLSVSEMEIHANRLLKLASPGVATLEELGPDRYTANWLTSASLWRITQDVIESQHIHHVKIENRLANNLIVKGTNPMLIGRIIAKILFELSVIKTEGDLTINNMPSNVSDGYIISFTVKNRKASGKGKASQLTTIGLRLKLFCDRLSQATGYNLQAPSLFQHDGFWEVRLPIQDILETTGDLLSSSAHGSSSALSFREQEIVEMVRSGYDNNDISSNLGITHATVKQHLKAIYRKLDVNNRIDLIFK